MPSDSFTAEQRYIVWFDIDNTLYPMSSNISKLMSEKIRIYFQSMEMDPIKAERLHIKYYTEYGLALRGLIKHHEIDPVEFNQRCDASLPLESLLKPNPDDRALLESIDRTKATVWGLTNAYKDHAQRVLKILKLDDLVDGIVSCDYLRPDFPCKPEAKYYHEALERVGCTDPSKALFVDDSLKNVLAAKKLGWGSSVYYREAHPDVPAPGAAPHPVLTADGKALLGQDGDKAIVSKDGVTETGSIPNPEGVDATISDLQQLRTVWAKYGIFKTGEGSSTATEGA